MFSMVAKAPTIGAFTCCIFFPETAMFSVLVEEGKVLK